MEQGSEVHEDLGKEIGTCLLYEKGELKKGSLER